MAFLTQLIQNETEKRIKDEEENRKIEQEITIKIIEKNQALKKAHDYFGLLASHKLILSNNYSDNRNIPQLDKKIYSLGPENTIQDMFDQEMNQLFDEYDEKLKKINKKLEFVTVSFTDLINSKLPLTSSNLNAQAQVQSQPKTIQPFVAQPSIHQYDSEAAYKKNSPTFKQKFNANPTAFKPKFNNVKNYVDIKPPNELRRLNLSNEKMQELLTDGMMELENVNYDFNDNFKKIVRSIKITKPIKIEFVKQPYLEIDEDTDDYYRVYYETNEEAKNVQNLTYPFLKKFRPYTQYNNNQYDILIKLVKTEKQY